MGAWVAPLDSVAAPLFLCPFGIVLLLRCLQRAINHAQAYARELLGLLTQFCQLDRIEVGIYGKLGESFDHLLLVRLLHRLAHAGGIKLTLVDAAAVRELI